MSYYLTIIELNLYYTDSDGPPLNQKDYHYKWYSEGIPIYLEDRLIKWSDDFVNDLLHMIELGIQGTLKVQTKEGKLSIFKLTKDGVKEFYGRVTYPNEPDRVYTKEGNWS